MRRSLRSFALIATLIALGPETVSVQQATGVVGGEVTDTSGGVLPGVTVVATGADGQPLATTITDEVGRYVFKALPAGPVTIAFQLHGFDTATVQVTVQPGVEASVGERLKLAQMTEEVVVIGTAPVDPPLPKIPYEPPAPPTVIPVPEEQLESVCGPAKFNPLQPPPTFGTIRAHRHEDGRTIYMTGDELVIDGGTRIGLEVGRNLVARRQYRVSGISGGDALAEHSSGLVQIVTANERMATAVVVYACDEVMQGDVLAAFEPERVRKPEPAGSPDYEAAARVLFSDAGSLLGAPRRLMVIDQGREQGLEAGQRLTLFRRMNSRPFILGEAIIVTVKSDSATIRVENATDAIWYGDYAAPQRR